METLEQQNAIKALTEAKKILLVAHRRPDGDTLGAGVGLHLALQQMGKSTTLACIDDVPRRMRFIPETKKYVKEFNMYDFDLIVISDAGASNMTGFHEKYPDFLSKKVPILNIDHHVSNEGFGTINIIDTHASSATMIVWNLIKKLPVKFTKDMGFALLTGIYNDTGGFMHSNTTQETFELASELAALGVSVEEIVRPMFKQSSLQQLRLWGHILETMKVNDKKVLSAVLNEENFRETGAHSSDTGGIIDLMNTTIGIKFAILLAEDDGWVKGSLRTQHDDVNVSDIAGEFGGGGHKKAAGFRVQGRLQKETVWKVIPKVSR